MKNDKTTDIEESKIDELCSDISTISNGKIEELTEFMKEKVDKIVADYEMSGQ